MSKFTCARKYSTDQIIARAFKEYSENVADNYSSLMSLLAEANELEVESEEEIESKIDEILSNNNIKATDNLVLMDGLYNVKELCKTVAVSNFDNDVLEQIVYDSNIVLKQVSGKVSTAITSIQQLFSEINATYHSCVCTSAVSSAYALADNVADRVQVARDYVSQKFTSAFSDVSGYLEDSINSIKNGASVTEWIKGMISKSGLNDAASKNDYNFTNSDSYKFSGATPSSAYCWNTTKDVIVSSVKVAATAVVGIVGGILSLGKKLFSKAVNKVYELSTDPYDLEEINKDSNGHTIDGYADQKEHVIALDGSDNSALHYWVMSAGKQFSPNKLIHTDYFCCEEINGLSMDGNIKYSYIDPVDYLENNLLSLAQQIFIMNNGINIPVPTTISDCLELNDETIAENLYSRFSEHLLGIKYDGFDREFFIKMVSDVSSSKSLVNELQNISTISDETNLLLLAKLAVMSTNIGINGAGRMVSITRYKPIDYKSFGPLLQNIPCIQTAAGYKYNTQDIINVFDSIIDSGDIYANCGNTEQELYNSFVIGFKCSKLLRSLLLAEAEADINDEPISSTIIYAEFLLDDDTHHVQAFHNYSNNPFEERSSKIIITESTYSDVCNCITSSVSVTNRDFFNIATGTNIGTEFTSILNFGDLLNENFDKVYLNTTLFGLLHSYKETHPLTYEFWPYEKNNTSWNESQFRIKTDSENINAFQRFVNIAVVVAAAVVVGVVAMKVVKRILAKAYLKQQGAQWNATEAASKKSLSNKDVQAYIKSTNRLNRMNALFGNTTTSSSSSSSGIIGDICTTILSNDSPQNEDLIIKAIRG